MIKTNLIISIAEDAIAGDSEAVTLKTTSVGNVIVEMHCPKVAIKLEDLKQALAAVEEFISKRPITMTALSEEEVPTFEFQYPSKIDSQQAI